MKKRIIQLEGQPIVVSPRKFYGSKNENKESRKTFLFRPNEYKQFISQQNRKHEILFQCKLFTGMRYEEMVRLKKHPEWIDGQFIHIPSHAGQKKAKRTTPERWIRLSYVGRENVKRLFEIDLPGIDSVNEYLEQWEFVLPNGNIPEIMGQWKPHISSMSFRKTYESWLVFFYPPSAMHVAMSQGHNSFTQFQHYLNMPFTEANKKEMEEYCMGWI